MRVGKRSMKSKMANNTSEHVAVAGTDSDAKFKQSDDLSEDLLKAFSNLKTVMVFKSSLNKSAVSAEAMTTMGNLFAQMAESIRKAMEQLSNTNRNLLMSCAHTPDRYFHGNTNHMFAPQKSSSSPQIYRNQRRPAYLSMQTVLHMKEVIFQQALVLKEVLLKKTELDSTVRL